MTQTWSISVDKNAVSQQKSRTQRFHNKTSRNPTTAFDNEDDMNMMSLQVVRFFVGSNGPPLHAIVSLILAMRCLFGFVLADVRDRIYAHGWHGVSCCEAVWEACIFALRFHDDMGMKEWMCFFVLCKLLRIKSQKLVPPAFFPACFHFFSCVMPSRRYYHFNREKFQMAFWHPKLFQAWKVPNKNERKNTKKARISSPAGSPGKCLTGLLEKEMPRCLVFICLKASFFKVPAVSFWECIPTKLC